MPYTVSGDDAEFNKRLKLYYPAVNEEETPFPKKWNPKDKFNFLSLSQDNLNIQYKGIGKTHRDAASVRATHPIPTSCGIYYYEVTVVSKGRDGYMGLGLSTQGVNLNRLPGWDKNSYGYHGDDGHSFCATGTGQPYGPTFTTGDVIGCCLNLVDNSCFYTKNGRSIGTAFRDLPTLPLFPTVGLQTPNEELQANFGQHPFEFDFEDYLVGWRNTTRITIDSFVFSDKYGQLQSILHKLVSTYLIHHGYVASTEAFNNSIKQGLDHYEDISSIKNRQKIQALILCGRIGEAIETTDQLFPGLLVKNQNLLFLLKVRQFIEMVNGTESEIKNLSRNQSACNYSSPVVSPKLPSWNKSASSSPVSSHNGFSPPAQRLHISQPSRPAERRTSAHNHNLGMAGEPMSTEYNRKLSSASSADSGSDMETDSDDDRSGKGEPSNGVVSNGLSKHDDCNNDMALDNFSSEQKQLCGGNQLAIERMMQFGQQLLKMSKEIQPEETRTKNKKILQDAYSLLAYTDPWNSPVGYQLDPVQREPICAALNSTILESQNLPKKPPLLTMVGQTRQCLKKMLLSKLGSAAFVSVSDYLR